MWAEHMHAPKSATVAAPKLLSRQLHRLIATIFTATVAANFAAMPFGQPPQWLTYAPLLPLLVLMVTGLVMLVAPHLAKRRLSKGVAK